MNIIKLATLYRAAYLHAHHAHHQTCGCTFLQDHAFYGELYNTYEDAYDLLVERAIGTGTVVNEVQVNKNAVAAYADAAGTVPVFADFVNHEEGILGCIKALKDLSPGTANLVQQLADDSEARLYKLRQLVK